jgi:hypothetical protein
MSGLHEVDCSGCGRRHTLSAEQAREQRVLQCACGQFVRMDRALPDVRSDPAPAPKARPSDPAPASKAEPANTDASDDEQTQTLDSLAAITALGNQAPRVPQVSLSGAERKSQPPPRAPMRSMSPVPSKQSSEPPGSDKPLWYVDLGGIETVEMTIEQLIIARRSGKLGEGALVWREGMPRWRPVGTLIPATSASTRPTPPPPPPSPAPSSSSSSSSSSSPPPPLPPPPPTPIPSTTSRDSEPALPSLGTYERPLATLEFALENPVSEAPRQSPRPPPAPLAAPVREQRSSQPMRVASPVPARSPTPVPARLPTPVPTRLSTPVPSRPATPVPQPATWTSTSVVAPLPSPVSSSVAAMSPVTLPPSGPSPFGAERPRWVTASLALLLCVAASGSGAFLVRSLKTHRQPLQLATNTASSVAVASSAHPADEPKTAIAPEPAPQVVDIASLSVEYRAPRVAARPVAIAPAKTPTPAPATDDTNDSDETAPPAAAPVALKPKTSDLPAAAHVTPSSSSALDDDTAKKAPAPSGDAPSF